MKEEELGDHSSSSSIGIQLPLPAVAEEKTSPPGLPGLKLGPPSSFFPRRGSGALSLLLTFAGGDENGGRDRFGVASESRSKISCCCFSVAVAEALPLPFASAPNATVGLSATFSFPAGLGLRLRSISSAILLVGLDPAAARRLDGVVGCCCFAALRLSVNASMSNPSNESSSERMSGTDADAADWVRERVRLPGERVDLGSLEGGGGASKRASGEGQG